MRRNRTSTRRQRPTVEALEARLALAGTLGAVWVGQDGRDYAGGPSAGGGNAVQDVHVALSGLPAARTVASVNVLGHGGGQWAVNLGPYSPYNGFLVRTTGATTADLYLDPYQNETGREFYVGVTYDDGSTDSVYFAGGTANANLRMPAYAATASWLGQDGTDLTGPGPAVGPDGVIDAHLRLGKLYPGTAVSSVTVTRAGGLGWAWGVNPSALNNAEFVRGTSDPSTGDLYLNPDGNLAGTVLTVTVGYADGKTDTTTVVAGATDPTKAVAPPAPVSVTWDTFHATWVGQDGTNLVGPGDVRLTLDTLPAGRTVVSAMVSDPVGVDWSWVRPGSGATSTDPYALPLGFRAGSDGTRVDLTFPPVRDESGAPLTVRLVLDNGTTLVTRATGGASDPGLRAPDVAPTSVVAYPGDDLNALANRYGNVRLTSGVYPMSAPLVLNRAVRVTADPGVTLLFAQGPTDAPWTAAVKVRASHTTLDGFAVRFAGPVRWASGISYGPAVVGATDNLDPWSGDPLVALTFTRLDLTAPPASSSWEEAPSLFRLANASGGRVADNRLKGGVTEFLGGPWLITGNTYLGTQPNTWASTAFAGHYTHDVTLSSNTAQPVGPSGKTWRFLVMTQSGFNDAVLNNTVVNLGALDTDTVPNPNAPEIILTEAYRVHYEGYAAAVSADGTVVQVPLVQAGDVRAGDVLSVLSGPQAGQWRTVAQVLGPTAFLLDGPVTPGRFAVSLATGFVRETYLGNSVDARGSKVADPLVLAGNQFGAKVIGNTLMGGDQAFRITAYPSETPNLWGWTYAPFLGATITGNTVVDGLRGGNLGVEHYPQSKTTAGRVYFSGTFQNNTGRWTDAFLARRTQAGFTDPVRLATVGDALSVDPGETVLTASGNRVYGPAPVVASPTFRVAAAGYNGTPTRNADIVLPGTATSSAPSVAAAAKAAPAPAAPPKAAAPAHPRLVITPPASVVPTAASLRAGTAVARLAHRAAARLPRLRPRTRPPGA